MDPSFGRAGRGERKREKERARGREKRYRRQEPVSPYFRFSSFRERSERLDIALSRSNGLSGERVHDLERSIATHVLQRTADLRTNRDSIIYIQ